MFQAPSCSPKVPKDSPQPTQIPRKGAPTTPKASPEATKAAPRGRASHPKGRPSRPKGSQSRPKGRPSRPKGHPSHPKGHPSRPKGHPSRPKWRPGHPQDPTKSAKESRKSFKDALRKSTRCKTRLADVLFFPSMSDASSKPVFCGRSPCALSGGFGASRFGLPLHVRQRRPKLWLPKMHQDAFDSLPRPHSKKFHIQNQESKTEFKKGKQEDSADQRIPVPLSSKQIKPCKYRHGSTLVYIYILDSDTFRHRS